MENHLFGWKAQYVSSLAFASKHSPESAGQQQASINEGQISVAARYLGSPPQPETEKVACDIVQALGRFGQLMAMRAEPRDARQTLVRLEFYDLNATHNALLQAKNIEVPVSILSFLIIVNSHTPTVIFFES